MADRSVIAYEHYREAAQRFEYFILGISGALCAYITQNLKPQKLAISPYTLEIASLLVLFVSIVVGFKRLEKLIQRQRLNHNLLDCFEKRGQLMAQSREKPFLNKLTGDVYTADKLAQHLAQIEEDIPKWQGQIRSVSSSCNKLYSIRNWLLVVGFVALIVSKLLVPYFSSPSTAPILQSAGIAPAPDGLGSRSTLPTILGDGTELISAVMQQMQAQLQRGDLVASFKR